MENCGRRQEEGSCSLDAALPVGCRPGFLAQVSSSPTITTIGPMLDVFLLAACSQIILGASNFKAHTSMPVSKSSLSNRSVEIPWSEHSMWKTQLQVMDPDLLKQRLTAALIPIRLERWSIFDSDAMPMYFLY